MRRVVAVSLLTLSFACARAPTELVGRVEGTDAFAALSVEEGGLVRAYVCDGHDGEVTIAAWLEGQVSDRIELEREGVVLAGAFVGDRFEGALSLDGEEHKVTLTEVGFEEGLVREDVPATADAPGGTAGWIQDDGESRGGMGIMGIAPAPATLFAYVDSTFTLDLQGVTLTEGAKLASVRVVVRTAAKGVAQVGLGVAGLTSPWAASKVPLRYVSERVLEGGDVATTFAADAAAFTGNGNGTWTLKLDGDATFRQWRLVLGFLGGATEGTGI